MAASPLSGKCPRYHLTVEAMPDSVPPVIRLRKFLKLALRAYGIKCIEGREIHGHEVIGIELAGADERTDGGDAA